ncbi:PREDICTED: receptor-type tyrosine-protein phosphatase eta isoform X2 [Wasmannia auropunctata]|uniref:receptor-type tyrosine-protein phosphatase eta isoform X2 n=1 Tax=Wasmannia auropunctata TaxID=64793 RepID=UPI0005EE5AC2|nr:PREDICTED: receptor-type tyrosine-protein phosphatase eta isoform X2 [Wasmannia auropunctata]
MILEKRPILLVLALLLLCALGNNDAPTSRGTTIAMSVEKLDYDPVPMENFEMIYDPGSMENNFAKIESDDAITTFYGSTVEPLTTVFQPVTDSDNSSSSATVDQTTRATVTVTNSVISTDSTINITICDPTWPENATEDTKEVINLKTDGIGTEWIALSWEPPCNVNATIGYLIYRCDDNKNCNETSEVVTSHNATNLEQCTRYTFNVKIRTPYWNSTNGVALSADTTISEVGDVISLSARTISVNVIQLTWQAPAIDAKCISNYSITQCDKKSCNETSVSATNYTANDLEPCTEYHFTVKTVTPSVKSAGVNQTAKTASPKLSAPQSLRVIPGNFSLTVKWEPPESGTVCLKHYHVTTDSNNTVNTTNTSVVISPLHACKMYRVYINAVNEDDHEGDIIDNSGTTLSYRTNPPVPHTPGIPPNVRSLSMIWTIQKENNHCQLSSIITICNYTEKKGKGYEPENRVSPMKIDPYDAANPVVVLNTTVEGLSPFTSYTCWAHTINIAGYSDLSDGVNATTLEDIPSPPSELSVTNITNSQFSLSWKEPDYLPGYIEEFEIIIDWKPLYPIPNWCLLEEQDKNHSKKLNISGSVFEYDYLEAKAFANYTVRIRAKTGEGGGWSNSSDPQTFESSSGVPEVISKFNSSSITIKENSNDTNVLDTILTWGLPCSLNGELEFFNISGRGTRDKYVPHVISETCTCTDYNNNDNMCSINLNELNGEYKYNFTISAKVKNVDTLGSPSSQSVLYPAGIPPQPNESYINWITLDPFKTYRSTTTAAILLPLFPNTSGDVKFYAIMVSKMGYNNVQSRTRFDLESKDWPNVSSWEESMTNDFSITYQATWPHWNPYPNHIADYGHIKAVKYIIGNDNDCKEISSNMDNRVYCNGPLQPDTWYHVRMRAFTDGGYTDSKIFRIKTNAELNIALVIGAVFGILFMGIVVTMMLLVRKCSPHIVLRRFLHSDMPGSPVPAPFTRRKFMSHCQQLVDNPGKLSNEFRLLQTLSVDLQMPTNTACLQANRKKNRYSDILPYDFSRVKLDVIDNDPNTDYINASFIKGYTGEDEYIACQGPKEETTYDFWRMVNQYDINIIVMLTQLVEKGKEKCHQYYPTIGESFRYENMMIRCTSELDFRTHTQRTIVLQKENKKRNITHLHFKDWPDHDVPEDFDAMIHFCQIMRRNIIANKGYIVIHCSAGIGRTGTLIAIDILLQQIRDNRKLDVFGTVYRLRHHRINMVQRESQYAYIYNCIKQVLKNPYCLKTYKPPPVEPVYENTSKKAKDTTKSDTTLVNNLEILKKHNSISMESLESIYNLSQSPSRNITNGDLRQCKSTGAINIKTHHTTIGKFRTLDCIFKPLRNTYELNREIQESLPLLTYSSSTDVLGESVQYATNDI